MAKDMKEAKTLMDLSVNYDKPFAIRYPRGNTLKQDISNIEPIKLGTWKLENKGKDIAIISYGPIVNELISKYKDYDVVNAIFQNPIDIDMLKSLLDKQIVIYDLYGTKEGFTSLVIDKLNELGYKKIVKCLCVPNTFINHDKISNQVNTLGLSINDLDKLLN